MIVVVNVAAASAASAIRGTKIVMIGIIGSHGHEPSPRQCERINGRGGSA